MGGYYFCVVDVVMGRSLPAQVVQHKITNIGVDYVVGLGDKGNFHAAVHGDIELIRIATGSPSIQDGKLIDVAGEDQLVAVVRIVAAVTAGSEGIVCSMEDELVQERMLAGDISGRCILEVSRLNGEMLRHADLIGAKRAHCLMPAAGSSIQITAEATTSLFQELHTAEGSLRC